MRRLILAVVLAGVGGTAVFAEDAAKLYRTKCAGCHGKDGRGTATMVKPLKTDMAGLDLVDEASLKKSDEELVRLTWEGVGKMPAQKGKMKKEEAAALVAYIRSLAPQKAGASKAP